MAEMEEQLFQIVEMLSNRYDPDHNVTTMKVFDRYSHRMGSRHLVKRLHTLGILEPYEGGAVAGTTSLYRVNLNKAKEYLDRHNARKEALRALRHE